MSDSCRDSKVEPGFDARYSRSSVLSTSTMKSDPGRSITRAAMPCARWFWALATGGFATSAAAPAAAPFKKLRLDFAIWPPAYYRTAAVRERTDARYQRLVYTFDCRAHARSFANAESLRGFDPFLRGVRAAACPRSTPRYFRDL